MASVQELLLAAEAKREAKKSPLISLIENAMTGYGQGQQMAANRLALEDKRLDMQARILKMEQERAQAERVAEEDRRSRAMMAGQEEDAIKQGFKAVGGKGFQALPSQKLEMTISPDEKGNYRRSVKIVDTGEKSLLDQQYKENQIALQNKALAAGAKPTPYEAELQKQEAKKLAAKPKEAKLLSGAEANFDRMIAEAKAIRNDPALDSAVGAVKTSFVPGTAAYKIKKRIDTLKSKTGFSVLQEMRASSPTGGALGNVSDRENQMLQENISTLDSGLSVEDFKDSLDRIIDYAESSKKRLRSTFNDYYGEGGQSGSSGQPQVKDAAARFDELVSSGTPEDEAYQILRQEGY